MQGRTAILEEESKIEQQQSQEQQQQEQAFLAWLRSNGAVFDSLSWPSPVTGSEIRGAVARSGIATGEHMVTIPHRLMMSEFHAKVDPDLGHVHRDNAKLLKGDNGLALYLMQELLKGEGSFYWPYLRVLPKPHNLRHWSEESLLELQDQKLLGRTALRAQQLRALYRDTMGVLSRIYPDLFPVTRYTFELFDFSWSTVQARAFGRRLKSSALVPFADCLNHGNVQTKYDFDVDGNGVFRLFPSGTNHYPRNAEVLNSYGRRANDNLLLEYGFAMLDNMWDTAEVVCSLSPHEPLYDRKKACLRASRQHALRLFHLRRDLWSVDVLRFYRCACLTASELDKLEAEYVARSALGGQQRATDPAATGGGGDCHCVPLSAGGTEGDGYGSRKCRTVSAALCSSSPREVSDESGSRSGRGCATDQAAAPERGSEGGAGTRTNERLFFPNRASSAENELAALTEVVMRLLEACDAFPTTLQHDEAMLQEAPADAAPDFLSALTYRVTVKRILARQLEMAERAIAFIQDIARKLEEIADSADGVIHRGLDTPLDASTPHADAGGNLCSVADRGLPESFVSYLSELENDLLLPEQSASDAGRCCSRGQTCRGRRPSPHETREM